MKEENSNSTSGVDNDKGLWEWLFGSVTSYPPTTIEPQQPETCLKCSAYTCFVYFLKFIIILKIVDWLHNIQ